MDTKPVPVLIAGGGPVGLALAVELGRAGIACVLVEKRDGTLSVPKMSGLSIRSMEFNRRWGIAEQVKRAGWPQTYPNDFVYCTSLTGYELARRKVPSYAETRLSFTPEPPCGCAQIFYDPILLDHARSLPAVTLRHLTSLDSFTQNEDCVRAQVTDVKTGRSETITSRYLVGCDGAGGTVARALGVGYAGQGVFANSLNIYFRSPQLPKIHDKGWARFYRCIDAGGSWGEVIGIDGKELWRLSVLKADPAYDASGYLRRLAGTDLACEILSVLKWDRLECVADFYRERRVFLAGDSAHQNSPTGGLGLHTGLADAVDLGWKLGAFLKGWGGEGLLRSYELERKPVAFNNVRSSTAEFEVLAELPGGPEIDRPTPEGAALRRRFAEAFAGTRQGHSAFHTENLRMGYRYEHSPIVMADGTTTPPGTIPEFVDVARSGRRAPHFWIGEGRSTLDLFGEDFVLLRLGAAPPGTDKLAAAAEHRSLPLQIRDLGKNPDLAALYERRLTLVRPDGHIAWRGDELPEDALALIDRVRGANPS
jgi:2-polyprenyl-6-methoxyphenol hydroxylase-like FAD-dependent oxidoreductase